MPSSRHRLNGKVWSLLPFFIFALIFAGACALNAVHVGFPVYWHPDEVTKALQIQTGDYNFYHPQLLLRLAMILHSLLPLDNSTRDIVLAGRFVSVGASAIAVTAFGVFVMRRFGIVFGIVTAVLLALTPTVFLNAHFFKEDATLLMGMALVMLAIQSVDIHPSPRNVALLGIAAGLAASAKYIGIIMVVPAVAMLVSKRIRRIDSLRFLLCVTFVFVAINSAGIFGSASLKTGLLKEVIHVMTEHDGISWGPRSARTLINFWQSTPAAVIAIWIAGMMLHVWRLFNNFKRGPATKSTPAMMDSIVLFTPLLLLATAQLSMVAIPRYVLPATVLTLVAAVWITATVFSSVRNRALRALPIVLLALGGAATTGSFLTAFHAFTDDPRVRLGAWIASHLPDDAKIAAEFYAGLPTVERQTVDRTLPPLPQTVAMPFFHLGMAGSPDKLRELGYTHMVLSSGNFDRFLDPTARLTSGAAIARKRFYEEVFATLTPVHEEPRLIDVDPTLSMRLLVYDIRTPADTGQQKQAPSAKAEKAPAN
ncbi:MAG: glycosyltransferase family 39 protein [Pseudomonadota bacterium]